MFNLLLNRLLISTTGTSFLFFFFFCDMFAIPYWSYYCFERFLLFYMMKSFSIEYFVIIPNWITMIFLR